MSDKVYIVVAFDGCYYRHIEGVFRTLKEAMEAYPSREIYKIEEWLVNQ